MAFRKQLKAKHRGPLKVIWDNAPAHRGEAMREYLRTPELQLQPVNLPGYSPDFNADEAIWGWAREEAPGNLCLGSRAAVQARVGQFLAGLANRKEEVRRRCRTSCNPGRRLSSGIARPIHPVCQMHISPWYWFSVNYGLEPGQNYGLKLSHFAVA